MASAPPPIPFVKPPVARRARQEIIALCHAGLDSHTLGIEFLKRLRSVMPIDVAYFITADPATLLFTGAVAHELDSACPAFIRNEFLDEDVNKFAWLVKRRTPVGDLSEATAGDLERSTRYREILVPLALGDELRAVFIEHGSCWGYLCLHRERSAPAFTPAEAAFLRRLTPHVALGLRKALLLGSITTLQRLEEPGVLLLTDDLSPVASTPSAQRWLAEVAPADLVNKLALPSVISALVGRLQALELGSDGQPELMPKARLRTASGHWLVLHASRLSTPGKEGQIAVLFEVAQPTEVAPLILQAYQLSKRESEIVQSVLWGYSTAEIAATLQISPHTVQDHLKAIFEKVGVRSRRELAGHLYAQQYEPRREAGDPLAANGWFA